MRNKNIRITLLVAGIAFTLISIIAVIAFLMYGERTIDYSNPAPIHNEILSCIHEGYNYPFFSFDYSLTKTAKVQFIFNENRISSATLKYTMKYGDEDMAIRSSDLNRSALHTSFGDNNIQPGSLNESYMVQSNTFIMTLYAENNTINNYSQKYFLIDDLPLTAERKQYERSLEEKGFKCEQL